MVVPHSGGYPHAKFEGNLLLFKFEPHAKSGLTIPQCVRPQRVGCARGGSGRPICGQSYDRDDERKRGRKGPRAELEGAKGEMIRNGRKEKERGQCSGGAVQR